MLLKEPSTNFVWLLPNKSKPLKYPEATFDATPLLLKENMAKPRFSKAKKRAARATPVTEQAMQSRQISLGILSGAAGRDG